MPESDVPNILPEARTIDADQLLTSPKVQKSN
jgi:hypothetical protein